MPKKGAVDLKTAVYKNKPLVRCGNVLYYGNISDEYVIKLDVLDSKTLFNGDAASKVSVQLLSTDPDLSPRKKIIKKCEKEGLYEALDIADVWLCKALGED